MFNSQHSNAMRGFSIQGHAHVASVHGMDYLVTWNCAHIAHGEIIKKLIAINSELGISIPVIVTPDELMEN
jgi:hypothetical protein